MLAAVRITAVAAVLSVLGCGLSIAGPLVIEDADFKDWAHLPAIGNGAFTSTLLTASGNPGSWLQTRFSNHTNRVIQGHVKSDAVYDPSSMGAISEIIWSWETIAETTPMRFGLLINQGDSYYHGGTGYAETRTVWTARSEAGLVSSSFVRWHGEGASKPDFTSGGPPISLGYWTSSEPSIQEGGSCGGLDNLKLVIYRHPVVSTGGPYTAYGCPGETARIQLLSGVKDPDGEHMSYHWSTDCPGASFDNSRAATPTLTVPMTFDGDYTLSLRVTDSHLGDATATAQLRRRVQCIADLMPIGITVRNGECAENTNPSIISRITNKGSRDAQSFVVRFYDGDPDASGRLIGAKIVTSLPGGAATDVALQLLTPTYRSSQSVWVRVDDGNTVTESDETNNTLDAGLAVTLPMPVLYALRRADSDSSGESPWDLIRCDLRTNSVTTIGRIAMPDGTVPAGIESLGSAPGGGFAYSVRGVKGEQGPQKLIRIRLADALAEDVTVKEISAGNVDAMTAAGHGKLYAIHTKNQSWPRMGLLSIDAEKGTAVRIKALNRPYEGLAITVDGWTLATSSTGRLYRINPSTGAESFVGETRDLNDRRILYTDLEALECLPSACGVNPEAFGIPRGQTSWTKHGCLIGYTKRTNQLLLINPETARALPISPGLDSAMSGGIEGMIFVGDEDDPASQ